MREFCLNMQLVYIMGIWPWIELVIEWLWNALRASENHNVPTFKKSAPHSIQNRIAHTLIVSNCWSISEPVAIKIICDYWPKWPNISFVFS